MKFRTFRIVAALGAVAAVSAAYVALRGGRHEEKVQPVPVAAPVAPAPAPAPAPTPAPAPAPAPAPVAPAPAAPAAGGLRALDQEILARARAGISGEKANDAIKGKGYKVNLYSDAKDRRVNRLKLDLDKDGKWDEKWTFEPDGRVKRQVATKDDETYDESYLLDGTAWKHKE
jgi:hypothetical protein